MKAGEDKIKNYLETKVTKVNGWIVISPFGDRTFFSGNWLLRSAAAAAGISAIARLKRCTQSLRPWTNGEVPDGSKHNYTITFAAASSRP